MAWGSSSKLQKVNIVSNNYSRYGTSVYNKLYSDSPNTKKENITRTSSSSYKHGTVSKDAGISSTKSTGATRNMATSTIPDNYLEPKNDSNKNINNDAETDSVRKSKSKSKMRSKYKSLITSSSRKIKSKLRDSSSDSFSIFSSKSHNSIKKNRRRSVSSSMKNQQQGCFVELFPVVFPEILADINELPSEILTHIMSMTFVSTQDILSLTLVSRKFNAAAKLVLYKNPEFTSTYRVAQFVTSLRLHPDNGKYVRSLDLSHLKNGIIPKIINNNNNDTESKENSPPPSQIVGPDYFDDNIAFAGWRDWRHKNESPALNSYNLKRAISRPSSISSMASSSATSVATNGNYSIGFIDNDKSPGSRGRTRSSSSVSSITSSIMSTFQNNSHVSLTSANSNPSTRSSSRNRSSSIVSSSRQRANSVVSSNGNISQTKTPLTNDKSLNKNSNSMNSISKWYNMKLRPKHRRAGSSSSAAIIARKERTPPPTVLTPAETTISTITPSSTALAGSIQDSPSMGNGILQKESDQSSSSPSQNNNPSISFLLEKPLKSRHPYTSRTLLKYAPYRDLPLGYILHILNNCPNLEDINLSNIVLFNDFKVINCTPVRKISSLLLPAVRESEIASSAEDSLEVVYMTDSNKNIETYDQVNDDGSIIEHRRNSSVTINSSWYTSATTKPDDYPKPIDSKTKNREGIRRQSKNRDQLMKLNPSTIFESLLDINKYSSLKTVRMDGSVWCRQNMVKYFILGTFANNDKRCDYENKSMSLSFLKSGMNRNFPWSCKGNLHDVTTIIVLDEILKMDDFQLEELYRIKTEKYYEAMMKTHDVSILETSNILPIKYGNTEEETNHINFRLTIIKSDRPTTYKISRVTSQNVSISVRLCKDENFNRVTSRNEHLPKDPIQRIDRLTHALIARVWELRNTELRRNIGENNYYRGD